MGEHELEDAALSSPFMRTYAVREAILRGNALIVIGENCVVAGRGCIVIGSGHAVLGRRNIVAGTRCSVDDGTASSGRSLVYEMPGLELPVPALPLDSMPAAAAAAAATCSSGSLGSRSSSTSSLTTPWAERAIESVPVPAAAATSATLPRRGYTRVVHCNSPPDADRTFAAIRVAPSVASSISPTVLAERLSHYAAQRTARFEGGV